MDANRKPAAAAGVEALGERQQAMLRLLQQERDGLTVEDLVTRLAITRTAVRQHLAALERDGYVRQQGLRVTGGRPGLVYALTPAGNELFPKLYSWFSALVLERLRARLGPEGLAAFMRELSAEVAAGLAPRLQGLGPRERVEEVARIMNGLGYDARVLAEGPVPSIVASNCVYHHLAQEFREVCEFDLGLLEILTGQRADHTECMVRGGKVCRFPIRPLEGEK
ncbi:MAG TPA: HTH domain-containing protein [Burkholderiales bacterium]|nr:HTH domain-containing protein [Burkholderiales bacterium]